MARHTSAVCRLSRKESVKLFLKGIRCNTPKCALEKKNTIPGMHSRSRGRISEYRIQLQEKQKVKHIAGVLEKQFRAYFKKAERQKGLTGANLLTLLSRRLDNVVLVMGMASSRATARQIIKHGHILVNNKKVDIPSFLVKVGDRISIKDKSKNLLIIKTAREMIDKKEIPSWVEFDKNNFIGTVSRFPERADYTYDVNEQLIVELYSK